MTGEKDAPAEMPGVEEIAKLLVSAHASLATPQNTARAILALFAPILAEKDAQVRAGEIMTQKMRELAARQKAAGKEYYDRALAAEAALAAALRALDEATHGR